MRTTVVNQAEITLHSLETKVGNSKRKRKIAVPAAIFLKLLLRQLNGTFVWDGSKQGDRFATIWEALAARTAGYDKLSFLAKAKCIQKNASIFRRGFTSARKWIFKWFGLTIYLVPQSEESSQLRVITVHPDFVLECGKTAAEMQQIRDTKLVSNQFGASTKRLHACQNGNKAMVHQIIDQAVSQTLLELDKFQPERQIEDHSDTEEDEE